MRRGDTHGELGVEGSFVVVFSFADPYILDILPRRDRKVSPAGGEAAGTGCVAISRRWPREQCHIGWFNNTQDPNHYPLQTGVVQREIGKKRLGPRSVDPSVGEVGYIGGVPSLSRASLIPLVESKLNWMPCTNRP